MMTFLDQFSAQGFIVPDLAVEDDPDIPAFVRERLMPTTEVYDAETSGADAQGTIQIYTTVIRPTVRNEDIHTLEQFRCDRISALYIEHAANATHRLLPFPKRLSSLSLA
jgi:hypothetical protein